MSGTGQGAPSSTPAPSSPAPAPSSPSQAPAAAPSTSPPPSGAPGGGTAPGGTPSRQEQMGVPNEVIAVLGYDPFGPVEEAPPQPPPAQPQAAPPQPEAATPPAGQPTVPPPNELETLKQQLGMVTRELQQMRQPAQQPAQPGQPGGQQPIDPVPAYQYEIPDQLVQLMASEDPGHRKMALSNVMTAVSRSVHGLMQKELAQVIPALARQVMMEHLGQQEVGKDFYSVYKDLDKPELRPLIYQIASGWAQQNPGAGWNAQTRDAIARVVYQTFGRPMPGNGAAAPPAAPVMMPTMSRPQASHQMTEQEEMLDLLR